MPSRAILSGGSEYALRSLVVRVSSSNKNPCLSMPGLGARPCSPNERGVSDQQGPVRDAASKPDWFLTAPVL